MEHGIPYGSRRGRKWASEIMATITGAAYAQSARMAKSLGTFEMYPFARRSFLRVINKHRMAAKQLQDSWIDDLWDQATKLGEQYGFRNAQVTVLAPTGTIGLAMDCETTGIEPELALVKYKNLIDGGILKYTNPLVWDALLSLGYDEFTSDKIFEWVVSHDGDIFSCPDLEEEHHDVFLTSFPPPGSTKCLGWRDHVDMMGACQPFVSGAISKTINLPETATEEDVGEAYVYAWKTGLKAVAVYRDGAKMFQPMTNKSETKEEEGVTPSNVEVEPARLAEDPDGGRRLLLPTQVHHRRLHRLPQHRDHGGRRDRRDLHPVRWWIPPGSPGLGRHDDVAGPPGRLPAGEGHREEHQLRLRPPGDHEPLPPGCSDRSLDPQLPGEAPDSAHKE
jgi:ribonucleoside-diphosphate reductase alpha chain